MKTRLINRCRGWLKIPSALEASGFTLVEIMIANMVMTTAMVGLLGSVVTLTTHSTATDARVAATQFQQSIMEDIRMQAAAGNDILDYNLPFETSLQGTMNVASIGEVRVSVQAVVPSPAGEVPMYLPIPVPDAYKEMITSDLLEIRIVTEIVHGPIDATYVFTGVVNR